MKNGFLKLIVFLAALVWVVYFAMLYNHDSALNGYIYKKRLKIGKPFILLNDTLIITDYNYLNGTYTLSNGSRIPEKLVN